MSKTVKIVLGAVGALLVLCICAVLAGGGLLIKNAGSVIKVDPAAAASTAGAIADFALPAGYNEQGVAFDMFNIKMAGFTGADGQMIMFLAVPPGSSPAENDALIGQMRGQMSGQLNDKLSLEITARQPVTVRGRATEMVLSEGRTGDGSRVREATVAFQGKSGPAIVVIVSPVEQWSQREIDRFLASIR